MTFLFDTICDDIIGEITKHIVWTKERDGTTFQGIQRLLILPPEKPIISLESFSYYLLPNYQGPPYEIKNEIMKNKIKKNKKGLITYTHNYGKYKQIEGV